MTRTNLIGCIACSTLMVGAVHAADFQPGFYAVGSAGQTTFVSSTNTNSSLASNSYMFSLGYEFTPSVSIEGGYGNLFTYNYIYSSSSYVKDSLDAFMVSAVYKPFPGKITPLLSVGSLSGTETYSSSYYGSGSYSYSNTTYGVGLEVPLDERSAFRLNYTGISSSKTNVVFAGILFRF